MTFDLVGRLAAGVGLPDAQARADEIAASIRATFEGYALELRMAPLRWGAFPLADRAEVSRYATMLIAVSLLVTLIGCVNVAHLLLARATERRAEIAIRRALGAAGTLRLFCQLFTENAALAALSGALALASIAAGAPLLEALRLPAGIDVALPVDVRLALIGAVVCGIAVLLFGLAPALHGCRLGALARRRRRTLPGALDGRSLLVAGQLAMALALVLVAGLLTRTWIALQQVDPGFDPDGVLTAWIDPTLAGHDEDSGLAFYRELLPRLETLPGVRAVALASETPLQGGPSGGGPPFLEASGAEPQLGVGQSIVTPGYFATLGIDVVEGRGFVVADTPASRPVAMVNRSFARRYFPQGDVLGRTVRATPDGPAAEIVGVVADYHHASLREPPEPHLYWPQLQVYTWLKGSALRALLVATAGDPLAWYGTRPAWRCWERWRGSRCRHSRPAWWRIGCSASRRGTRRPSQR